MALLLFKHSFNFIHGSKFKALITNLVHSIHPQIKMRLQNWFAGFGICTFEEAFG
jgi:hypothetical protein